MGWSSCCCRGRFVESVFQSRLGGSFEITPVDGWGREAEREIVAYARPQGRKKCTQGNWYPWKERRAMLSLPLRVMSGKIHQDQGF